MQLDTWPRGERQVMENAGNAPTLPCRADEIAGRQSQPAKAERLFHLLADQHQASLVQVAANQNAANQQIWDQVAQLLMSQQPPPAPVTPATARPWLPSGVRAQKMTPEDDPEAFMNAFE